MFIDIIDAIKCIEESCFQNSIEENNLLDNKRELINIRVNDLYSLVDNNLSLNKLSLSDFISIKITIEHFKNNLERLSGYLKGLEKKYKKEKKKDMLTSIKKEHKLLRKKVLFFSSSSETLNSIHENHKTSEILTFEEFKTEVESILKFIKKFDIELRYLKNIEMQLKEVSETLYDFLKKNNLLYKDTSKDISLFHILIITPLSFNEYVNDVNNNVKIDKRSLLAYSCLLLSECFQIKQPILRKLYKKIYSENLVEDTNLLKKVKKSYSIIKEGDITIHENHLPYLNEFCSLLDGFNEIDLNEKELINFLNTIYFKIKTNEITVSEKYNVKGL